jgi:hypothetical protein
VDQERQRTRELTAARDKAAQEAAQRVAAAEGAADEARKAASEAASREGTAKVRVEALEKELQQTDVKVSHQARGGKPGRFREAALLSASALRDNG